MPLNRESDAEECDDAESELVNTPGTFEGLISKSVGKFTLEVIVLYNVVSALGMWTHEIKFRLDTRAR